MPDPRDSYELMLREQDRECRRNYGFGIDDIPPMTPDESRIRVAAINAVGAANHNGRRPTYHQLQKVERYNEVARRYRALADAELLVALDEINQQIDAERAAGTYVEPGISWGCRAISVVSALVSVSFVLLAAVRADPAIWLWVGAAVASALAAGFWKVRAADPRIDRAIEERTKLYCYWKIIR